MVYLDSIIIKLLLLAGDLPESQDLFNANWTQGNLYSIQPVTNILGKVAVWVISAIGFCIVIFSIMKNAMSGLYVVNPPFWDKVDALKEQAVQGVSSTINDISSHNEVTKKLGGLFTWLLGIIPNVKALTDFDGDDVETIDKKQYFAKAIPLLVAQIFIGMLIFFGYPAKIANWIGTGATHAIQAVLDNVDPVETVQKVSTKFVKISLATDGSQVPLEANVNTMTRDMVAAMRTKYTDISASNSQDIAYVLETNLLQAFPSSDPTINDVLGVDQGYRVSVDAKIYTKTPSVTNAYKKLSSGVWVSMGTNGTASYVYWIPASDILGADKYTTKLGASDYFVWRVSAVPEAISDINNANLIVCAGIAAQPRITRTSFTVPINGITVGDGNGANELRGTLGNSVTVDIVKMGSGTTTDETVESLQATLQSASVQQTKNAQPLLTFAAADREKYTQYAKSGYYFRVNLVGDWKKTITSNTTSNAGNAAQATVKVTELRLTPGGTKASYIVSSWENADELHATGVDTIKYEMLSWSDSTGKGKQSETRSADDTGNSNKK